MEVRNYSLADHTISIKSKAFELNIGNGSSLESINISFENDTFEFSVSADGTATLNKNYMKNGTITLSLQQTNPFVNLLLDLYNKQMVKGITDTANMTIEDVYGNVKGTFTKCVINKIPNYDAGKTSSVREFVFIFGNGSTN